MSQLAQQMARELRSIWNDKAVLVTIVGGILFYAILYPQPYLGDRPDEQPVVVVDLDRSTKSRQLIRWADATQDVKISRRVGDLDSARRLLVEGEVRGILLIPAGFEKDLALGRVPQVSLAGDANYFLVYGTVIEGLVGAVTAIGAESRVIQNLINGVPLHRAEADWSPIQLHDQPLFNMSMGYLGYVVPAVFVLILQQTLLLAGGLLGAARNEASLQQSSLELWARFLSLFSIYLVLAIFYMGICFEFYNVVRSADILQLSLLIAGFVAASTGLAIFLGVAIRRREHIAPVVLTSSLPFVFTAGFVWPMEAIPETIRAVSQLVPSTAAIPAFLKLNQMNAEFLQVINHFVTLVALALAYMAAAEWLARRQLTANRYSKRT